MIDNKAYSEPSTPMWHGVSDALSLSDSSSPPLADKAASAGDDLLKPAEQRAHTSIDRFADGIAPTVHQLEEGVASAAVALKSKTDQIRETRDRWSESARRSVRTNPLGSVVGALAIGALIARITR